MLQVVRRALSEPLAGRKLVPPLAALFAVASAADPAHRWWEWVALAVPVLLFVAWYVRPRILPVLAVVGPVAIGTAIWTGGLEPALFILSLLALTVAAWQENRPFAAAAVVACVLTPLIVEVASPHDHVAWGIWALGILFPAVLGLTIRRLERVTAQLVSARQELADLAVVDERHRIARDVHDLVGHGLAAVLLHVTGARHVLRRDPDAADEALATAEAVGRASMADVRRTVDLLREDGAAAEAPTPGLAQLRDLVSAYRSAGLPVRLDAPGLDGPDAVTVPPTVGLTAYRIAQQALANAAQHAPAARTGVTVVVDAAAGIVRLGVDSDVAVPGAPTRTGHGLVSMHERARAAGGRLVAGPTSAGWSVRCVLPLDPGRGTAEEQAWLDGPAAGVDAADGSAAGPAADEAGRAS